MALFNITSAPGSNKQFRLSNANIHLDTLELKISEINITTDEWNGIF
jgi:hypothetical protein